MSFTVLHAPGYAPRFDDKTISAALRTKATVIGFTEAYRKASRHMAPGYRTSVGHSSTDTRAVWSPLGDAGDNPLCVSPAVVAMHQRRVDTPGRPAKYAPERWLNRVYANIDDELVCVISVHPSPVFCGLRKWNGVMRAARTAVRHAKSRGVPVVLIGDLQTRAGAVLLRSMGLRVWRKGVDFIAYSKELELVKKSIVTPAGLGLDHPWMLAGFRARQS